MSMSQPPNAPPRLDSVSPALAATAAAPGEDAPRDEADAEIFVWFEDLRRRSGRGAAGLPECLLPLSARLRVLERRYAEGHLHLLRAVRLRCTGPSAGHVAMLYVGALAAGTLARILTGRRGREAWIATYGDGAI